MKNRIIALMLLFNVTAMSMLPVYGAVKEEKVYTKLAASGKSYKTIVSAKLLNDDDSKLLKDMTTLYNITNINGDETFEKNGNVVTWKANGNDIYYQGETKESLPIECKIKYELNGKEIDAKEIVGKKGTVKITLKYINKESHVVNINGKFETLYTPFVVVAGTSINNENSSNITVTNGKVIDDGTKSIVVGMALPGLQQSLNISKSKIDLPDSICISMDAEKFELNNIIFFATTKILQKDNLNIFNKLDALYSKVSNLEDASNKLSNGTEDLVKGSNNILSGVKNLKKYIGTAKNGTDEIKEKVDGTITALKEDNSPAVDNNTLSQIENMAYQKSKLTDEQKSLIATKAKIAATLNDDQKKAIGDNAVNSAKLTDERKQQIASAAEQVAILTSEQLAYIETQAVNGATLSQTQKDQIASVAEQSVINSPNYNALTDAEKQTIGAMLIQVAKSSAVGAAENMAKQTAKEVSVKVAQSTAKDVAKKVSVGVAENVTAEVARNVAIGTAEKVAQTTAKEVAISVAQSISSEVAQTTAKETAKQVANTAKQTFTKQTAEKLGMLSDGLNELSNGMSKINNGAVKLYDGTTTFNKGLIYFSGKTREFDNKGIQPLCNYINGDVKNLTTRAKKLSSLSNNYNCFTMKNKDIEGNTQFIMMTDSLKIK